MIISRAPLRLPLGGGGTDLPAYYSKHGGFWLSGAINRHMYIVFHNRSIEPAIKLRYSKNEEYTDVNQIQHPIFREVLKKFNITSHVEIHSVADVGAGTGLGSSGSFAVSLLNALHSYRGESVSPQELAEEACDIAMNKLHEASGKQDEYAAAFGDIHAYSVDKKGNVTVEKLELDWETVKELENNLLLFFTKYARESHHILSEQQKKAAASESQTIEAMGKIKEIGHQTKKILLLGETEEIGPLLDEHWQVKKTISSSMSNPSIDKWYALAKKNGATGGKIMGAGGGGFFMFYCPPAKQHALRKAMTKEGLTEMRYMFDPAGVRTIFNITGDRWT